MPNPIKYSTGSETLVLKKGNFYKEDLVYNEPTLFLRGILNDTLLR